MEYFAPVFTMNFFRRTNWFWSLCFLRTLGKYLTFSHVELNPLDEKIQFEKYLQYMCSLLLSILILILSKMHFQFDEFVTLVAYFYILYYLYCVRVVSDKKDLSYIFIIDADTRQQQSINFKFFTKYWQGLLLTESWWLRRRLPGEM